VVQEKVDPVRLGFPIVNYGQLEFRDMRVDVHPHAYMGRVMGCSTWLSTGTSGFSSIGGIAPTYVIDPKA
jgi:hypothetical protein